jgi:exopolyphosphatase/guanosine-5'-triphosphate,3'-diphosphate pyrophosphatase
MEGIKFTPVLRMEKNIAIIDMGTNTFHLLVAELGERSYVIIHQERLAVKIGMGGINDGWITEEGADRALKAIQSFQKTIHKFFVENILAFGTSALRNAKNGLDIIRKIKDETGIETRIISGDEEATYIYKGVRAALQLGNKKSLIVDIGGGSVEFIIGNENEIFWKQSFEIGAQRLLEKYQKHDPILPIELDALKHLFLESLRPLFNAMEEHGPQTLIGSSGTFDTLSDIYCFKTNVKQHDSPETPLKIDSFYEIFEELTSKNREERLQIPGMIEMRVDMIVVAGFLIKFLLDNFSFKKMRVSSYSLKEGVLASSFDI